MLDATEKIEVQRMIENTFVHLRSTLRQEAANKAAHDKQTIDALRAEVVSLKRQVVSLDQQLSQIKAEKAFHDRSR